MDKSILLIMLNLCLILILGTLLLLPIGEFAIIAIVLLFETVARYLYTCRLVAIEDLHGADEALIPFSWTKFFRSGR